MEVDVAMILGAIVENEGGSYEIPFQTFQNVLADPTDRAIVIDYDADREVLVLGVTGMDDVALEEDNE